MTNLDQALTAPYAPSTNIAIVLDQIRSSGPGLIEPVTTYTMRDLGIPEGNTPRATMTLKYLGIINTDGMLTDAYTQLRHASEEEFRTTLAGFVRQAYRPIFEKVDPSIASVGEIERAFIGYNPEKQLSRIVTLFMYLCQAAGIRRDDNTPPQQSLFIETSIEDVQPIATPNVNRLTNRERVEAMRSLEEARRLANPEPDYDRMVYTLERRTRDQEMKLREIEVRLTHLIRQRSELPPYFELLAPLLRDLPREGKWTKRKRDRWIEALGAQIDYVIETEEPEQSTK